MCTRLSNAERAFVLKRYHVSGGKYGIICHDFRQQFGKKPPSRLSVDRIIRKFDETSSIVDLPRCGRPRTSRSEKNIAQVAELFEDNPTLSLRKAVSATDIARSSLYRIVRSDLKLKPFRSSSMHAIHNDDAQKRLEFCRWFLSEVDEDEGFLDRVMWTDEACFKINGRHNRKNVVHWSTNKPHNFVEHEMNVPGVTVWCGIQSTGIIGPYFFADTVTGESYLRMLEEYAIPSLHNHPDRDAVI